MPFVARYRKEATGSLDEVEIAAIRDRLAQLEALDQRRQAITASLEERNLLTDALQARLAAAETLAVLEDVYLPFRPKRRTRATIARDKGLEPLAEIILRQDPRVDPAVEAARFVTPAGRAVAEGLEVPTVDDALQGARDVIAERINDDAGARARIRRLFWTRGILRSEVRSGKAAEGVKYKDYFDWSEPIANAPSHRVLAIRRGETEEILSCSIRPPEQDALSILDGLFVARSEGPGVPSRCASPCEMATSACSRGRWRPKRARRPRPMPTPPPSASSRATSGSCSWRRHWARSRSSRSTLVGAPAARPWSLTLRVS